MTGHRWNNTRGQPNKPHGVHLNTAAQLSKEWGPPLAEELAWAKNLVEEFGKGFNLYRKGCFLKIAGGFFSLYRLFESAEKPWQASELSLGSRKRFGWFE